MLLKSPDAELTIDIKSTALSVESSPTVERQGLTEQRRRDVYMALALAEDRANDEALTAFPLEGWGRGGGAKWDTLFEKLRVQYVAEAARKYALTQAQIDGISEEGIRANWPLPEHR